MLSDNENIITALKRGLSDDVIKLVLDRAKDLLEADAREFELAVYKPTDTMMTAKWFLDVFEDGVACEVGRTWEIFMWRLTMPLYKVIIQDIEECIMLDRRFGIRCRLAS